MRVTEFSVEHYGGIAKYRFTDAEGAEEVICRNSPELLSAVCLLTNNRYYAPLLSPVRFSEQTRLFLELLDRGDRYSALAEYERDDPRGYTLRYEKNGEALKRGSVEWARIFLHTEEDRTAIFFGVRAES